MAKYRVHYDAINPNGKGRMTSYIDVEAESDFMASSLAEAQFFSRHPTCRDYTFQPKRIEKK